MFAPLLSVHNVFVGEDPATAPRWSIDSRVASTLVLKLLGRPNQCHLSVLETNQNVTASQVHFQD